MTKEMNLDTENNVVMSNALIKGKSNLSLNELKLLRLAIMQIVKEQQDFQTYTVNIIDLAKMLDISRQYIYREADTITTHIMQEIVFVGSHDDLKKPWKKFQWVSACKYESGTLTIRLNDELKPYLLGLSKLYTQYVLSDIICLKSVYSIRLYELIRQSMMYQKVYADKTATVYLSIEDIRTATDTADKYEKFSMFRARVIDSAIKEIREKIGYNITYTVKKKSRSIIGFTFTIESAQNIKEKS